MNKSMIGEKARNIVPRWRGFASSLELTDSKAEFGKREVLSESFLQNQTDWNDDPSLWNALDFIAGAIVENRLDLATPALEQVKKDLRLPSAGAAFIAAAENEVQDADLQNGTTVEEESIKQIRTSRRRLAEYQWDAVEWVDLARSFTNLGQIAKAARCISAAVKIAPTNRFIVRSASRFYVHTRDPERAIRLLSRANIMRDPWIMAPQVAISSIIGRTSVFAKDAMRMLQQDFSARDLSELGAALGTLQVENGRIAHAKKLLRQSIVGANENSIAQVEWLNRARLGNVIDVSSANPPRLYEAGAWTSFIAGDWDEAHRLSELWFRDQPFSGNAATLYSYILSDLIQDYNGTVNVLSTALRCNPGHPILINNFAFALINLGRLDEAETALNSLVDQDSSENVAILDVTRGLLEFRKGNIEIGRAKYLSIIDNLVASGDQEHAGRAAVSLASEELRLETPFLVEAVQTSLKLTAGTKIAHVLFKVKELQRDAQKLIESTKSE